MSPGSGSGTGTPISLVPCSALPCEIEVLGDVQLGLTLDRYQELMRLAPAAFNGLVKGDEAACYDCAAIWKQSDRDAMAIVIAQAEEMRERELQYHIAPKYIVEEQRYCAHSSMYFLEKKHLIKIGTFKSSDIAIGAGVTLRDGVGDIIDPVTMALATTVTDPDEICVFHPGSNIKINPIKVTISGGTLTLCIPRPRLKLLSLNTDCEPFPDYEDDANFEATIDIKRCYIDETDGIDIVWHHSCCDETFSETVQTAYGEVKNYRLSVILAISASYASGIWTRECLTLNCVPDHILVPYWSGIRSSIYTEMTTAGLANSLLKDIIPQMVELCNCWKADQVVSDGADWNPYGISNGAIKAWLADSRAKVGMGGKF